METTITPAVTTRALTRQFGHVTALDDVNFTLPAGATLGLLGPNGSGKTTLLSILAGFITPTSGDFSLLGQNHHRAALARTGSLISGPMLWSHLSCRDNLRCVYGIHTGRRDWDRVEELLGEVGLAGSSATRKFGQCSTGMKQRLGIAAALIDYPDLLLLDEPTNGLDPEGMVEIRELVRELGRRPGRSIIMSSHLLNEVELTCDHYAIIYRGQLAAQGRLDASGAASPLTRICTTDNAAALQHLLKSGWSATCDDPGGADTLTIATSSGEEWKPIRDLAEVNIFPTAMGPAPTAEHFGSLEEIYLATVDRPGTDKEGDASC